MIDDRTVAAALERLALVAPAHWPTARAEVQDGGTFLLLSVQLAATDGVKVSASERDSITRELNAVVPPVPEQTLGSWMLVVKRGAKVEESILPNGV
jgi:hypothetical protein